ncbi:hypothetical protein [Sphaerisporangium dianthi]|uniref:Uncharacterized protein n=1 Tax=Sphaerisporangium dianthi TaxID=1436120 RepID=A0ABV9CDE1_9ACTN
MKSTVVEIIRPAQPRSWYNDQKGTAANGGCSQHGTPPCHEPIVATVVLANAGSDNIQLAVCQRGLDDLERHRRQGR